MGAEWVAVVAMVIILTACTVGPLKLMKHIHAKRLRLLQLHAPLLSEDHRLDAALRQAEGGFNVCLACGFDNFKRSTFCTICGVEIIDPTRQIDQKRLKEIKKHERRQSRKQLLRMSTREQQEERAAASLAVQDVTRARRQRRTRKRKEWQRKVDVKNRMFWYRTATKGDSSSTVDATTMLRFPGYVLQVQKKQPVLDHVVVDQETTTTSTDAQVPSDPPVPEPRTTAERAVLLVHAFDCIQFDLIDAASADATRLPSVETPLDDAQKRDVVMLFQRDFPSKYAHFVTCTANLIIPADVAHLRLNVHRTQVYADSIASFAVIHREHMKSVMRINFVEENGIDAGGVHREWFALFIEKIVDPKAGLFVCVDKTEQTYYLNPHSCREIGDDHLMHFFATGRLLGRALLEGFATGFHLALPLLKIILGVPVSFNDLEFFDPEMYKSMLWIVEHDGVDQLGLDFSVTATTTTSSEVIVTDLIPNGRNIAVTDANKMQFLERKFRYMLFESVDSQLYALLNGIYEVIPQDLLMMFDPEEFDHVLCGSDEIDVDDWEKHTKYTPDLHDHVALRWFWELVREMPNEYRRRLLLFSTGSSRVPLAGFSALTSYDGRLCPFTLSGVMLLNEGFIMGHACFNRIDLPRHVVREELEAVLYATLDTDQYGFTTD